MHSGRGQEDKTAAIGLEEAKAMFLPRQLSLERYSTLLNL